MYVFTSTYSLRNIVRHFTACCLLQIMSDVEDDDQLSELPSSESDPFRTAEIQEVSEIQNIINIA